MTRIIRYIVCLLSIFAVYGYAKSVWTTVPIYQINIKPGDIIRIKFAEKTLMKYKIEQNKNKNVSEKGVTGKGDMFSFFPDIELKGDDTVKSKNELNVNNQSKFMLPAKVESVDDGIVSLKVSTDSVINGQLFGVLLSGQCSIKFISPDFSVYSYDIDNLNFEVKNYPKPDSDTFSPGDLLFSTNFAEIMTNYFYTTNIVQKTGTLFLTNGQTQNYTYKATNLITNFTLVTNMSSIRVKLEGFTDTKQKEILIKYIGIMMNSLFK